MLILGVCLNKEVAMPQRTYHYTAFMPIDGSKDIVHVRADDLDVTYRFISFERSSGGCFVRLPVKTRGDIIVIALPTIGEQTLKCELADLNGGLAEDVEIELHSDVWLTVGRAD